MSINRGYGILRPMAIIIGSILLIKLFLLQVVSPSYKLMARNNVVKMRTEYPARGLMFDRNGLVVVYNDPVYNIMVQYNRLGVVDTAFLCELLDVSTEYFLERMERAKARSPYKPYPFLSKVPPDIFARFQENLYRFEGFSFDKKNVRRYPYQGAAHVLGYISEVNDRVIANSGGYYRPGDQYGEIGLEQAYEASLRGEKGTRFEVVDVFNNVQGAFDQGGEDVAPVAGEDLVVTLDIELQTYGEQLMQNKVGSVVAIEPSTGEVLAYISSPGYDPNYMSTRYRGQHYRQLLTDSLKPLYNRPLQAEYPPGSTFKPIMSLVAFQEGIRPPAGGYDCKGGYRIPGHTVGCHEHTPLLHGKDAIRHSCNSYYCDALKKLLHADAYKDVEEAYKVWHRYLSAFGYGNRLGIDLQNEKGGNLPTVDYYNRIYGQHHWKATTVISLAIGQGEILATPLQMANTMAAIANRGHYYTPHLVRPGRSGGGVRKRDIPIDQEYFEVVIDGMEDVFLSGTARMSYTEALSQCGKTGTAENPHGDDHSLFVAFAPKEDPRIAIAVIVENAGYGSTYAAPIASLMMEYYVNDSVSSDRRALETRMLEANTIIKDEGKE